MNYEIGKDECVIDVIANNPSQFDGRQVQIERSMMNALVFEARESGEENVALSVVDKALIYDVTMPGEVVTKLQFADCGIGCVLLTEVVADDIKDCTLIKDYKLCEDSSNIIAVKYKEQARELPREQQ